MGEARNYRVAIIGPGGIGMHHLKLLKQVGGVDVVAAADVNASALTKANEQYGILHTFSDYKQMLKDVPEIEAVDICSPNGLHARHTIDALEAGKHVMVEKPMAMNAGEAQAMIDAAWRSGKQLIVGFQNRFDPKSKFIRDQILAGSFGKILYVRAQALRRRGIPSWGVFGRKDLQGGGPLIDIGVHVLENAHYMIGSPRPLAATGGTFTYLGDKPCAAAAPWGAWDHSCYTVEDLAVGMVRFEGGTMLSIESSFAAHIEKDEWNITIMGEKGGASWASSQVFKDEHGYMLTCSANYVGSWDSFEYKMRHFVEVCRDGRANETPGQHGLMIQKILDALYSSAEQGREVTIE